MWSVKLEISIPHTHNGLNNQTEDKQQKRKFEQHSKSTRSNRLIQNILPNNRIDILLKYI